ncbi:MAG TPA: glycosyltransferase family 1 protein [Mycobacteriales bacterium]|nr:glycosyltransferase family 1 protein [Mycobacteriales bacterium]
MPPRVLVDATAVPADRGGLGRYVDNLLLALARAGTDLVLTCQRADAERYRRLGEHVTVVPGPPAISHRPARLAWEQTGLPQVAEQVGAEVVHAPHYTMPLRTGCPVVVTLHDVTMFTEPAVQDSGRATFFRSATRTALRRADRCVVPSAATRDELVRVLDADAGRIDVAYHGVDRTVFHRPDEGERARVSARLGLDGRRWIAFLGKIEPRKNVPNLVRAWVQAFSDREDAPALVVAGASGWDDDVDRVVREVPAHLRVLRPGYLRITDLPGFLGGATMLAYPTLGEGFGLPVLEAMSCGAPVLTSRRLAIPEVGGDAVEYTDVDPDSLSAAMLALYDDEDRRRALTEAGLARAEEFTWDRSAAQHLAAYEAAAGA